MITKPHYAKGDLFVTGHEIGVVVDIAHKEKISKGPLLGLNVIHDIYSVFINGEFSEFIIYDDTGDIIVKDAFIHMQPLNP